MGYESGGCYGYCIIFPFCSQPAWRTAEFPQEKKMPPRGQCAGHAEERYSLLIHAAFCLSCEGFGRQQWHVFKSRRVQAFSRFSRGVGTEFTTALVRQFPSSPQTRNQLTGSESARQVALASSVDQLDTSSQTPRFTASTEEPMQVGLEDRAHVTAKARAGNPTHRGCSQCAAAGAHI